MKINKAATAMPSRECKADMTMIDNKVETVTTIPAETRARASGTMAVTKDEDSNNLVEISLKITNNRDTWLKDLKTSNSKTSEVGETRATTSKVPQA